MAAQLSKAYLLTKVMTASTHEVVVYLYEGVIGHVHRAREAMEAGNRAKSGMAIDRAIAILIQLSGSLNYQANSKMALRLDSIYHHLIHNLTLANAHCDQDSLDSCESILTILHDAWKQAAAMEAEKGHTDEQSAKLRVSA